MPRQFGHLDYLLPLELSESKRDLVQRLEGHQIVAWEFIEQHELPQGWRGIGLQIRTSAVLFVMSAPAVMRDFHYLLVFRWLPEHEIITRSMERMLVGRDQPPALTPAEQWARERIVGQMIRTVAFQRAPTAQAGERMTVEFSGGEGIHLEAMPDARHPLETQLDIQWYGSERRIFGVGVTAPGEAGVGGEA